MAIEITDQGPAARAAPTPPRWRRASSRLPVAARLFFTERLGLLLESGVALHAALATIGEQMEEPRARAIIADLREQVLEGKTFSHALGTHPEMFSLGYVNLVVAAESGGFLPEVLNQLREVEENAQRVRSNLLSALAYPAFLVVFSMAVVVFVLATVFPKFKEMFANLGDQLPMSTRVLMAVSDALVAWWPGLLALTAAVLAVLYAWFTRPAGRELVDRLLLALPVVRGVTMQLYLMQTMRVMGLSLSNGVSVMDALESCRDLVRNTRYRAFMGEVETGVQEGKGLAAGFDRPEFVPALVRQMISTGEQSGTLARVMLRIAQFYEVELTRRVTTLSKLAEPVMLLVMGALVGLIVSSLILPIFKLARAVH